MFIMQNNESRLIKAAKRTIRAEATLVIIIIVISSWSIFALYKFTTGSDSFFGLTFVRPNRQQDKLIRLNDTSNVDPMMSPNNLSSDFNNLMHQQQQQQFSTTLAPINYSQQQDDIKQKSQQLLRQLIAGQRELYANLDSFRGQQLIRPVALAHQLPPGSPFHPTNAHLGANDEFKLVAGYRQLPLQLNQQQLSHLKALDRSSDEPNDDDEAHDHTHSGSLSRLNYPEMQSIADKLQPAELTSNHGKMEEDREAAESSREPGESVIDGTGSIAPEAGDRQTEEDENPSSSSDGESSSPPGGTEQEPSTEQEASTAAENQEQDSSLQTSTPSSEPSQPETDQSFTSSSDESEPAPRRSDGDDDEAAPDPPTRESSQSVDDEVERMTQPSSGRLVVHQQERPFDYKNTVQFDDSLSSGFGSLARVTKAVSPGDQVARFEEAPQKRVKSSAKKRVHGDETKDFGDLQVDHNSLIVRNGNINDTSGDVGEEARNKSRGGEGGGSGDYKRERKKVITRNEPEKLASNGIDTKAIEFHNVPMELVKSTRSNRQKRDSFKSRTRTKIGAPYEIEDFLGKLDFDSLLGLSSSISTIKQNQPRASDPDSGGRSSIKLNSGSGGGAGGEYRLLEGGNKSNNSGSAPFQDIRRLSFGDKDDASYETIDGAQFELSQENMRPNFTRIYGFSNGSQPMPSYVTSNNTDLQELLNQRSLLDALKYSQLPAPNQNYSNEDTKTAGTLYHVDHGLMLVPSADERHSHKKKEASMTKNKKKHKKSKDKKKSTVAHKKGGHKKKKHEKEEKKYLKEKKFKGAKKGKKVSKGKGGAGGKKGKKLYKDKGFKKKGFKKVYHKEEWGNKKSFFDEFRDKDFKKKWKKFDDKYNYAQMKKFQAKDEKGAKKMKHHDEMHKKYDKGKWKKTYHKHSKEHKESSKKNKKKKSEGYD